MDTTIMTPKLAKKYLLGLSLVELMVALVISSILMAGVIYIFNVSKRTYTLQTALAELHDNARFVIDELTREVRMAGYFGCSGAPPAGIGTAFQSVGQDNDVSVGADFPKSDTLRISSFSEQLGVDFTAQFLPRKTEIPLASYDILPKKGERIIVSNCRYAHFYDVIDPVATLGNQKITISPGFRISGYLPPIEVFMEPRPTTYQVLNKDDNFALYKCEPNCGDEPFVDGVQNMQVRYGIDADADSIPNQYVTTPTGRKVVSVRITLLMRTTAKKGIVCPVAKAFFLDKNLDYHGKKGKGTYSPMEDNEEAETGYCHRLFTTTIDVRNSELI